MVSVYLKPEIPKNYDALWSAYNSLRTVCVLTFPSFVNVLILYFASLLDILFLQCGPEKYTFQVVSFRTERAVSLSRLAKVLKLISLCNLHPLAKELCWRLLDSPQK